MNVSRGEAGQRDQLRVVVADDANNVVNGPKLRDISLSSGPLVETATAVDYARNPGCFLWLSAGMAPGC